MGEAEAQRPVHVLGFTGSPKRDSNDRALSRATQELAPAGMTVDVVGLAAVPHVYPDGGYGIDEDEVGIARCRPAGTAGAAPGTA